MVAKASNKVVVVSMPSNMIEGVMSDLSAQEIEVNDHIETSLEPKPAEEPKEETSEEEE
jgi:hypothetical protein